MLKITFPDQTVKEFNEGITSLEIAKGISEGLARRCLAAKINEEVWELTRPIHSDSTLRLITWDDPEGKSVFWHSSAHLMAEAIEALYSGVKFGIGPPVEWGFYYDVDLGEKTFSSDDFKNVEDKMKELAGKNSAFIRKPVAKKDALEYFTEKGDEYKLDLINDLEDGTITFYTQGNFTDLCRGPHIPNTGFIKAVKLLNVAGAYWRGDEKRKQLTRIYGITFPKQGELEEFLKRLEEAKKRDHRKLGKELEIFHYSEKVGMGLPLWLPKGVIIRERLENFLKTEQRKRGYTPVMTPHIGKKELYVTSGHYEKYGKESFQPIFTPNYEEEYLLKPMNCPHHCEIFKSKPHSYRDLPVRLSEFGTVYRYEQSGELNGLTRTRGFTQDDAHIFCREDQVKAEFISVIDLVMHVFEKLGFSDYTAQVSLSDPKDRSKYIGSQELWQKAEQGIIDATKETGLKTVTVYGEAAFYGPKLDFMVKDVIGRNWQLGTIQVDYNLPNRFELEYTGADNVKHRPVMIHRAPFGSMERFIGILIEHCSGNFPLWLTPEPVVILPVSEKYIEYGKKVALQLNENEIPAFMDDKDDKVGKKIRDSELKKIPFMLVVGEKEEKDGTVAVRRHGKGDLGVFTLGNFVALFREEAVL